MKTVLREIADRRILHIATHGLFRDRHPILSGLGLADGWLTLHDVFGLHLAADLVTLAACQTNRGHVGAGDELLSLARGFLHAGARSVLAANWPIDDRSARRMMRAFYGSYQPDGAASALRTAMLAEMAHHGHPYHWASFTLMGA